MSNNNEIDELNKEISVLRRSLVLQIKTSNEMNKWVTKMSADIERVRDLHKPVKSFNGAEFESCESCSQFASMILGYESWVAIGLCPTIRALNGEQ